jgi:hypothetical protein
MKPTHVLRPDLDRAEATNTGGWIDAEDDITETCSEIAVILRIALELHSRTVDEGERVMITQAADLLETIGRTDDEPDAN